MKSCFLSPYQTWGRFFFFFFLNPSWKTKIYKEVTVVLSIFFLLPLVLSPHWVIEDTIGYYINLSVTMSYLWEHVEGVDSITWILLLDNSVIFILWIMQTTQLILCLKLAARKFEIKLVVGFLLVCKISKYESCILIFPDTSFLPLYFPLTSFPRARWKRQN